MHPRHAAFRDTLQDLRLAMLQRFLLVALLGSTLALYFTLLEKRFQPPLFWLMAALTLALVVLRWALPRSLNVARFGLMASLHTWLLLGLLLTPHALLPFFGVLLVLVSGLTISHAHWVSAGVVFAMTALLAPANLVPVGLMLALMLAVMKTAISSLYTALSWYSAMQQRADLLLDESREHRAELAQTVKSLDVTHQTLQRAQQQLIFARQQADDARRMKERFAANISHELRTPLNLIVGFSEIMVLTPEVYSQQKFPPKLARDLYQIYSSSRHLREMIDDVLDLSHVELSAFSLNYARVDLNRFLADIVSLFQPMFRDGRLDFGIDIDTDLPTVEIDATRIRQVLLNLMSNARRFTEQGMIMLSAHHSGGWVEISLRDTGMGIAPDKLEMVFDEFYQVDYSLSRSHGGAGLGLAISKRFVEAHGGIIQVESSEGVGSVFTFTLPVRGLNNPALANGIAAAPPTDPAPVLVIEQDTTLLSLLRRTFDPVPLIALTDETSLREAIALHQPRLVIRNVPPRPRDPFPVPLVECSLPSASWMIDRLQVRAVLSKPVSVAQLGAQISELGQVEKVLIVDDDLGFVQFVQRGLETLGDHFTVQRAYDGAQALEQVRANPPDVILLDLSMPEMDGFAVLEALREDPITAAIPVILLTATRYLHDAAEQYGDLHFQGPDGLPPAEVLRLLRALVEQVGASSVEGRQRA